MRQKGFAPIIIIIGIVILGIVGYFVYPKLKLLTQSAGSSLNEKWKVINCVKCSVVRITQSVWNGPTTKAEPDKVWEIEAKVGEKTTDPNLAWTMEVVSADSTNVVLKFSGKIYKDMVVVNKLVTLSKNDNNSFDTGTTGGGAVWDIIYIEK